MVQRSILRVGGAYDLEDGRRLSCRGAGRRVHPETQRASRAFHPDHDLWRRRLSTIIGHGTTAGGAKRNSRLEVSRD